MGNDYASLCCFSFFIVSKVDVFFSINEYQEIPYTRFEQMVENKEVQKASINFNEAKFVFTDVKGNIYLTDNPRSEGFKAYLLKNNVEVVEKQIPALFGHHFFSTILSLLLWVGVIFSCSEALLNL